MEEVDVLTIDASVVGLAITAKLSPQYANVLIIEKNLNFG